MTDDPIERLRAESSRADHASMARLANALYAQGLTSREVLRQCYGVDFPAEFFATAGERLARPHLLTDFTDQPWTLGMPTNSGAPPPSPPKLTAAVQRRIFVRDPDLVPLMRLAWPGAKLHDTVICYRLTELRAGSTAIFGIKATVDPRDGIVRCGESLLAVLHAHHTDVLHHLEWIVDQPWNRGFGAVDERTVDEARSLVDRVEALQRQVASSGTVDRRDEN